MAKFKNLILSLLFASGFVFALIEMILNLNHSSLCHTEGCKIVDSFAKSEPLMLLAGAGLFAILLALSLFKKIPHRDVAIDVLLILAMTAEGYLVSFQVFTIQIFCLFCMIFAGIVFISAFYRFFIMKRTHTALAFISFAVVFFMSWFVNPTIGTLPNAKYVLIYSKDCPHCHQVLEFCQKNAVPVVPVEVSKIKGACKSFNIDRVPVLVCNCDTNERKIIQGDKPIIEKLSGLITEKAYANVEKSNTDKKVKNKAVTKSKSAEPRKLEKEPETLVKHNETENEGGFCPINKATECK